MIPRPHEPTDECFAAHCHVHHVDESRGRHYLVCAECNHVYRTRLHLLVRAGWLYWRLDRWRLLRYCLRLRPAKVVTCPYCAHDF